jgi:hypothetical protein
MASRKLCWHWHSTILICHLILVPAGSGTTTRLTEHWEVPVLNFTFDHFLGLCLRYVSVLAKLTMFTFMLLTYFMKFM